MIGSLRVWSVAVGALLALGGPALAATTGPVSTPHVRAELVASADAVRPGDSILVGVHKKIIPHWHTYWKNPGDSGQATSIEWALPAGAKAGDIQWPMPSRFRIGPLVNYGYENDVTLLTEIAVPEGVAAGSTFTIRATVDWREPRKLLKLRFPTVLAGGVATFEVPYGFIERAGDGAEQPGQSWIDLSGDGAGLALLNDGKYSFDVAGGDLAMTVLRSPIYAHHDPLKAE